MSIQTTNELVAYYAALLIIQYQGKAKAMATVETNVTPTIMPQTTTQSFSFAPSPTSGSFALRYPDVATTSIIWNASAATIQTQLRGIAGLEAVTVAGSIAAGFVVTFAGVTAPAALLEITSNTLLATATPVEITTAELDLTLPLAVQDAFNLFGSAIAQGVQLDTLGKYAGVRRTGPGFSSVITLSDAEFYTLIQIGTVLSSMGSSLSDIQNFILQFFPSQMFVFDYANMHMSYLIDSSVGSQDLIQLFITQGLLPKPMGVQLTSIIYIPNVDNLYGWRTYETPGYNVSPLNSYADYQMDRPWLSYRNGIVQA